MAWEKIAGPSERAITKLFPTVGCAGCFGGINMEIILEVMDEFNIPTEDIMLMLPAGCSLGTATYRAPMSTIA